MNVVVDTNIFIAACLGKGAASKVIRSAIQEKFTPLIGTALYLEYEAVLDRDELFNRSRLNRSEREDLLDTFLAACRWTPIYFGWRPNLPDEGDNHLMELAVAGNAQYIVSWNVRDFEESNLTFDSIRTLNPAAFMQEIMK